MGDRSLPDMRRRAEPSHESNPNDGSRRVSQTLTVRADNGSQQRVELSSGRYRIIPFALGVGGLIETFGMVRAIEIERDGADNEIAARPFEKGAAVHSTSPLEIDLDGRRPSIVIEGTDGINQTYFQITRLGG